jgi:hypothetical protein
VKLKHRIYVFRSKLPPELQKEFMLLVGELAAIVLSRSTNVDIAEIAKSLLPPEYKPTTESAP